MSVKKNEAASDLLELAAGRKFRTILADPPWQFQNRTGRLRPSTIAYRATRQWN
jgi:hypothetical protein